MVYLPDNRPTKSALDTVQVGEPYMDFTQGAD